MLPPRMRVSGQLPYPASRSPPFHLLGCTCTLCPARPELNLRESGPNLSLPKPMKKEALALIQKDLPEEAQPPVKKRKKIIKQRLPQGLIDYMMENPFILREIPQERLTARSQRFLESYAKEKAIADKVLQYEQALINQYLTKGYAEREVEVTDDESEEN